MSEVAREYGAALYELAAEENAEREYLDELLCISEILTLHPEYIRLLTAPNVPVRERIDMLDASFGGRCREYILSFMKLMVERGYAPFLCECISVYEDIYLERHGIVRARVTTASELREEKLEALKQKLESHTQKKVQLTLTVDPSLIGGIRVEIDGKLLEGSIRSRLDRLRSDITNITI